MSNADPTKTRAPIKPLPSAEYLRECFSYNRKTGVLRWLKRPRQHFSRNQDWLTWNMRWPGTIAGKVSIGKLPSSNRRFVSVDGKRYGAHRIIWKIVTDSEPSDTIDHIDLNPDNNAWDNLRVATPTQQQYNRPPRKSVSGHRCVYKLPSGKWQVRITINNIGYHRGVFDTLEKALAVYKRIAMKLHGKFYWQQKP